LVVLPLPGGWDWAKVSLMKGEISSAVGLYWPIIPKWGDRQVCLITCSLSNVRAMSFLKIVFITLLCHLIGAAVFAVVMDWPDITVVVFSPLMALAGWFMAVLMLPIVSAMWGIRGAGFIRPFWLFILAGAVTGLGVGAIFTGGPEARWRLAFAIAGFVAGAVSNIMIVLFRMAERSAALNGGPPTQLGNSGTMEGPPSVS
jgi:hypothetical protein